MDNQTGDNKKYKVTKISGRGGFKPSERECHLCIDCANGYPLKCQKIMDVVKKPYKEYGFIKAARQTFDENNKVLDFAVKKCDNYVPTKTEYDHHETKNRLRRMKRLRGALAAYYFDTTTADEAYLLQAELEERGHFKPTERLDDKTLEIVRQRVQNKKKI